MKKDTVTEDTGNREEEVTIEPKKWTFMFYDDAEFEGFDALGDFRQSVGSHENLNVFALQDSNVGPATLWYIDEEHTLRKRKSMGEINVGDYRALYDFIDYCKTAAPAEKYILAFYDHGAAWEGACRDETNDSDILTMDEIQRALTDTGGVDVVCFSAPCLMGSLESVYELRNCTDVYIGSEDYSGYMWWFDTMTDIYDILKESPGISNIELGEKIIESVERHSFQYPAYQPGLTMSAVRTDRISDVIDAVDALVIDFMAQMEQTSSLVQLVYDDVHSFHYGTLIDAYDFAEKCHGAASDSVIRSRLDAVMLAISNVMIAECHGSDNEHAHGLSIYFPDNIILYKSKYENPTYGLDFSAESHWDEFMNAYFELSGVTAVQQEQIPLIIKSDGFAPPPRSMK